MKTMTMKTKISGAETVATSGSVTTFRIGETVIAVYDKSSLKMSVLASCGYSRIATKQFLNFLNQYTNFKAKTPSDFRKLISTGKSGIVLL